MKDLELQLHDLQILLQSGDIPELFKRIFQNTELFDSITSALKYHREFRCGFHGPMYFHFPEPKIECQECESLEIQRSHVWQNPEIITLRDKQEGEGLFNPKDAA